MIAVRIVPQAQLDASLDTLHLMVHAPDGVLSAERLRAVLERGLAELGLRLDECFAVEEAAPEERLDRPDLTALAGRLRREHPALRNEIDTLLAESACGLSVGALRRGAAALVAHTRRHLCAEEALAFRETCEDIGAAD